MPFAQLSSGAIQKMVNNDTTIEPRLQVLDVKKIVTVQSGERYRVVLSDGNHYIQGMLSTQMSQLVVNNQLRTYCIIHLRDFVCNNISGRKICVVIRCDVLQQLPSSIGNPQNIANPNTSRSLQMPSPKVQRNLSQSTTTMAHSQQTNKKGIRTPLAQKLANAQQQQQQRPSSSSVQPRPIAMVPRPVQTAANHPRPAPRMPSHPINRQNKNNKNMPVIRFDKVQTTEIVQTPSLPTLEQDEINDASSNNAKKRSLSDEQKTMSETQTSEPPRKKQRVQIQNNVQSVPNIESEEKAAMDSIWRVFSMHKQLHKGEKKKWAIQQQKYKKQIDALKKEKDDAVEASKSNNEEVATWKNSLAQKDKELSDLKETLKKVRAELDGKILSQQMNEKKLEHEINEHEKLKKEYDALKEKMKQCEMENIEKIKQAIAEKQREWEVRKEKYIKAHEALKKMLEDEKNAFAEKTNEMKRKFELESAQKWKQSMIEKEKQWELEKKKLMKQIEDISAERADLLGRQRLFFAAVNELTTESDDASMNIDEAVFDTKCVVDEKVFDDGKDDEIDSQTFEDVYRWEESLKKEIDDLKKTKKECRCVQYKKQIKEDAERWQKQRKAKNKQISELEDEIDRKQQEINALHVKYGPVDD